MGQRHDLRQRRQSTLSIQRVPHRYNLLWCQLYTRIIDSLDWTHLPIPLPGSQKTLLNLFYICWRILHVPGTILDTLSKSDGELRNERFWICPCQNWIFRHFPPLSPLPDIFHHPTPIPLGPIFDIISTYLTLESGRSDYRSIMNSFIINSRKVRLCRLSDKS